MGQSDRPKDPSAYTSRRFAGNALAILDAAGIDRAHVCGVSMGGFIAQWLAIDHADQAKALSQQAGASSVEMVLNYSSIATKLATMAQIVQSDLAKIGIKLTLNPLEAAIATAQNREALLGFIDHEIEFPTRPGLNRPERTRLCWRTA